MRRRSSAAAPRPLTSGAFFPRVYAVVRKIPRGRVMTYGGVAAVLGNPRGARAVGWALRALRGRRSHAVPWHRVIGHGGRVSLPGESGRRQRLLLIAEGVRFAGLLVDTERHLVAAAINPARAAPMPPRSAGRR